MSPALQLSGVSASLGSAAVLREIHLDVGRGELVALCGPNGAGKTTLLRAGLGLTPAAAGEARLFGRPLRELPPGERAALAGYLPQERRVAWGLPALQVAALGAVAHPPAVAEARAAEALAAVGLAGLEGRSVFDMSGGERARVLLARLLATRAPLLVADEPVAGLDPEAQLLTLELLRRRRDDGAAVLVTLHDLGLAARFADRVVVLEQGRVAADGPPREALGPAVLARVFGLSGGWLDSPDGPVLHAGRAPAA